MNDDARAPGSLPRHPIAVVAERTGLSQDVLRVWERRYGAVHPERTPGGQRLYRDADVERLRLLLALTRAGRSIGQVAALPLDALARLVDEDAALRQPAAPVLAEVPVATVHVEAALALAVALDAHGLDGALRRAAAALGIPAFLEGVAVPLMRRIGEEWHAGRLGPAQERVASLVVHDIVAETMRSLAPRDGAPRLLVTTPAGERHAIGAALVGAAAAIEGWDVIYLGADLPASEITSAAMAADVRLVALSVVFVDDRERVLGEIRGVRARLPAGVGLLVGGAGAAPLARELEQVGARVGASLDALRAELALAAG